MTLRPGNRLVRRWRGRTYVVEVTEAGLVYDGERHSSLSVIAGKITGTRWSGPKFFGLARLKVIDRRLRQISTDDAASVLAGGLAMAGINEQERLRLVAETERILDELDGKSGD